MYAYSAEKIQKTHAGLIFCYAYRDFQVKSHQLSWNHVKITSFGLCSEYIWFNAIFHADGMGEGVIFWQYIQKKLVRFLQRPPHAHMKVMYTFHLWSKLSKIWSTSQMAWFSHDFTLKFRWILRYFTWAHVSVLNFLSIVVFQWILRPFIIIFNCSIVQPSYSLST